MQRVAEWRASVERVLALDDALQALRDDSSRPDAHAIIVEKSPLPTLCFHDLTIADADGAVVVDGFSAEVVPGERVLIGGDPAAAVKLFKVVAGLWPWGKGTVSLPCNATLFFLPQRPYMPIGSLRGVLAYPSTSDSFSEGAMREALNRVGLGHLVERLRQHNSWEQCLSAGEQQRLGFARLLLHRPRWVFLQEATDALDPEGERRLMQMLTEEFHDATILTVGFHTDLDLYHQRTLSLTANHQGKILVKESRKTREQQPQPPKSGWSGRLLAPLRRRNERRSMSAGMGKHGDWRN
jgi:putative ATP-binding cassette transporter